MERGAKEGDKTKILFLLIVLRLEELVLLEREGGIERVTWEGASAHVLCMFVEASVKMQTWYKKEE